MAMNQGKDQAFDSSSSSGSGPGTPYQRLGVEPDASFDLIQARRDALLAELPADDPMARSRIDAAYDAILMDRLKERQQGRVSTAARSASQREQVQPPPSRPALSALPRLPQIPTPNLGRPNLTLPALSLASGQQFWLPVAVSGVLLILLFTVPTAPAQLLLALATLVTVYSLQRRNGRFLQALGWSFALLTLGLLLGGLLLAAINPALPLGLPIGPDQVQSLPALLLLLLGGLLIA
ncbi:MAG: CPP1-like family protein [Cyanobacteria bacterium]|nr:CPP1-like family protein [Cyanobacteriota bacterium]